MYYDGWTYHRRQGYQWMSPHVITRLVYTLTYVILQMRCICTLSWMTSRNSTPASEER
jgi:uncharacterized membrane protein YgaE (UPF0421/DUF939 family)